GPILGRQEPWPSGDPWVQNASPRAPGPHPCSSGFHLLGVNRTQGFGDRAVLVQFLLEAPEEGAQLVQDGSRHGDDLEDGLGQLFVEIHRLVPGRGVNTMVVADRPIG
ncbi:hypothetical protein E2320_011820, partial [Naja naja]